MNFLNLAYLSSFRDQHIQVGYLDNFEQIIHISLGQKIAYLL